MNDAAIASAPSGIEVIWKINRTCNFRCGYCFDSLETRSNPANRCSTLAQAGMRVLAEAFDALPEDSHIAITGGEPFLHPEFVPLCALLVRRHRISVVTNLSSPLAAAFADTVPPARVTGIRCSLHLLERERLGLMPAFRAMVNRLKDRGFNAYITEVLAPPILPRLESVASLFERDGLTVWPVLLRGRWGGRRYPGGYTRPERRMIRRYYDRLSQADESSLFRGFRESRCGLDFLNGQVSFFGLPCETGRRGVFIQPDGAIQRCPDVHKTMGNLFDGTMRLSARAAPCPALVCSCPWNGYQHASGRPRIYGRWSLLFNSRQRLYEITRAPATPFQRVVRAAVHKAESVFGARFWPQADKS